MPEPHVLVVGAAVVRHGRVLATRRTRPPEAAGLWELPGGKVEPDEDPSHAVVREVREELGCDVVVTGMLRGAQQIRPGWTLRVALAELVDGEPVPHEHDAVRWLAPEQLDDVVWLEPDRPFLDELRQVLRARRRRAFVYDEGQAHEAAARLRADGFEVSVARERFAGEDDDEDHPWVLVTDAPPTVLETLVEEGDGWMDDTEKDEASRPAAPPLDLPDAPRRIKGHFRRP